MTPFPSAGEGAFAPVQAGAQEILTRLAKPSVETGEPSKAKPRRVSIFLVGSLLFLLALVVAGVAFLRDPKALRLLLMSSDSRPMGAPSEDVIPAPLEEEPQQPLPTAPGNPPPAAGGLPAAQPRAAAPPTASSPPPTPPAQDFIPDQGEAAVALVKNYPLDGDRGTVGQWLQFSFAANPGDGNKEEWTAGAVEANKYLVQYRVLPGANSSVKEPITYLFEADVSRRTVKGSNPAARQLLGGGGPSVQPKRSKPRHRPSRRQPREASPGQVPLMPLPSDSDLLPPAEDDAPFGADTVHRGI